MKLELPVCLTVPRVEINVEIYSWFPFASTHAKIQETESLASPNTIMIIIIIIINNKNFLYYNIPSKIDIYKLKVEKKSY